MFLHIFFILAFFYLLQTINLKSALCFFLYRLLLLNISFISVLHCLMGKIFKNSFFHKMLHYNIYHEKIFLNKTFWTSHEKDGSSCKKTESNGGTAPSWECFKVNVNTQWRWDSYNFYLRWGFQELQNGTRAPK